MTVTRGMIVMLLEVYKESVFGNEGAIFYRLGKFYNGPLTVNFKKDTLKLCSTRGKIFVYFKCWVLHLARDLTGSSGPISSCGQFAFYGTGLPNLFVFECAAKKKLCR